MTALCNGGSSQAKPGFGAAVSVGIAQVAALLNNVPTPLAVALAGYIGLVGYELATFCNSDPPPLPVITAGDFAAALLLTDYTAHAAAIAKFQDYIANMLWPEFCECASVATPAPPGPPPAPNPVPDVQPSILPTAPTQVPCWDKSATTTVPPSTFFPLTDTFLPTDGGVTVTGGPTPGSTARPIPSGVTTFVSNFSLSKGTPFTGDAEADIWFFNSAGAVVGVAQALNDQNNVHPGNQTHTVNAGATFWQIWVGNDPSNGQFSVSGEISFFCSGQSANAPQTPCCPPDPSQQALLQTILQLVQQIFSSIPAPLNSYADATVHAGLHGNGTITLVSTPLAVRVDITTDPSSLGTDTGSPPFLFDRGFIVPVINAAPVRGFTQLVYNPQIYILPALTEQIGYTLHPGVVATITELVRGP